MQTPPEKLKKKNYKNDILILCFYLCGEKSNELFGKKSYPKGCPVASVETSPSP